MPQSSLQASWDSQHPRPDLRLLVIEPHDLGSATLARLEEVGWGLCHVTVPPFLQSGTIPQYTLSYRWRAVVCVILCRHLVPSKLYVWNMTQYSTLLWLDSDTLVVTSLHTLLARADRSMSMSYTHKVQMVMVVCAQVGQSTGPEARSQNRDGA